MLVPTIAAALLAVAASCSSEPPTTAILISADERSEAAYFPDLGVPRGDSQVVPVAARPTSDAEAEGAEANNATDSEDAELSELYEMSASTEAVDRDALREAVGDAADVERSRWASASGVDPAHLDDYVKSLIPVWTARDIVLTEHGPEADGDRARVVIYETGSPLLVRPDGSPAVGGNSGNPLSRGPDPSDIDDTKGEPWEGFDLDDVVPAPEPSREDRLVEPTTTTSTTAPTTTTTEKRPRFEPIDPQDMEWAFGVISETVEVTGDACIGFDVLAADRSAGSLAFRENVGAECGGDSLSTVYVVEFDRLVASASACGDCEFDATGERDEYLEIVDRFDQSWWIEVPRTLITGDNDCGLRDTLGDEIRLVAKPPIDCATARRIFNAYMASDDMQGSSAFADVEDFTCWVDLIPDPVSGDVTGACEGPRGVIEMQIP